MKIGYCTGVTFKDNQAFIAQIEEIKQVGFDYIELPISSIATCTEEQFESLRHVLHEKDLHCEVCNLLFPPSIPTTGPSMNLKQIEKYIQIAFKRSNEIGARILVFGSSGSRNIKAGETTEKAKAELKQVLELMNQYAILCDIIIAIEPLNHNECNLITHTLEGYDLCKEVHLSHIKLLVDYYHLAKEQETIGVIQTVQNQLVHVHMAEPEGRGFPSINSFILYQALYDQLKQINYGGRMSIEANIKDIVAEYQENYNVIQLFKCL